MLQRESTGSGSLRRYGDGTIAYLRTGSSSSLRPSTRGSVRCSIHCSSHSALWRASTSELLRKHVPSLTRGAPKSKVPCDSGGTCGISVTPPNRRMQTSTVIDEKPPHTIGSLAATGCIENEQTREDALAPSLGRRAAPAWTLLSHCTGRGTV